MDEYQLEQLELELERIDVEASSLDAELKGLRLRAKELVLRKKYTQQAINQIKSEVEQPEPTRKIKKVKETNDQPS